MLRALTVQRFRRLGGPLAVPGLAAAATVVLLNHLSAGEQPAASLTAAQLVQQAQRAQEAGNSAQQFALLRRAVQAAPDYEVARWQLGQLKVGDHWMPVEEVQRAESANVKQADYRRLRAEAGQNIAGQLALARWCRKNELRDEAQFHWASVLAMQRGNEEALRALDMQLFGGQPMTRPQIAQLKQKHRAARKAAERWEPMVARWRRAVSGADPAARHAALGEVRSISDVAALPAMEAVTLGRDSVDKYHSDDCRQLSVALVEALAGLEGQAATYSLVRHAVLSPSPDVREFAATRLEVRPAHEYVPLLLGALSMPIESSFNVVTNSDGCVHYYHSLYREGPLADWAVESRLSAMQHDLQARRYTWDVQAERLEIGPVIEPTTVVAARQAAVAARSMHRYGSIAARVESEVAGANRLAESLNDRVIPVLKVATGQDFESPKAWWDWWLSANEYYADEDHPVDRRYYSDVESHYHRATPSFEVRYPTPPPQPPGRYPRSCFAKGTPVWTKTGQQPIETIELGDMVLAKDVDTGELAYKPVIGRTVRPPSPILSLQVGGKELHTTRGHPFWVAGVGWRMAKELGDGAILQGVTGSTRVASITAVDEAEAYNLIVADFNTYFVGANGILVHDNTLRRPTAAQTSDNAAK